MEMKKYNYAVYANFDDSTKCKMIKVMDYINDLVISRGKLKNFWREEPHITVFYGPSESYKDEKSAEEEEKRTKESICNCLLKVNGLDFYKEFNGILPEIKYKGVSHFKRYVNNGKEVFYIIKFEFETIELTDMQMNLRDMYPSVNEVMLKDEEYYKDGSRSYPPINWAHSTITFVENIKSERELKEIEEKAEEMLVSMGIKRGDTIKINEISMISCYSDTAVKLW